MLKKTLLSIITVMFVAGCATTSPMTSMSYAELELKASTLSHKLDVNIVEFDPGFYGNDEAARTAGVWPELRRAESRKFAVNLSRALNESNAFSAVSVTTSSEYLTDIIVTGMIVKSNGEDIHLQITAIDSTGTRLINNKLYKHRTSEFFNANIRNKDIDPFDAIYRGVVGDIIEELSKKRLADVELVTDLRFAKQLNESQFYDAVESSPCTKANCSTKYELGFVPASNDPMFLRAQNVQLKDLAFRNEMQKHYIGFSDQMDDSYKIWQSAALKASKSKREAEAKAATQAFVGVLLMAAAASSASNTDYGDYNSGAIVAATVGAGLIASAVGNSQEAKVHESTINEVSQSFDGEIAPKVVEMEGLQVKLEGNIENQFSQWQTVLADIYESESSQTKEFEVL